MREGIADLPIGESYAKTRRFSLDEQIGKDEINDTLEKMRNTLNASMRRAMNDTGNVYTIENGSFLTRSGHIMLVVAVTRTE